MSAVKSGKAVKNVVSSSVAKKTVLKTSTVAKSNKNGKLIRQTDSKSDNNDTGFHPARSLLGSCFGSIRQFTRVTLHRPKYPTSHIRGKSKYGRKNKSEWWLSVSCNYCGTTTCTSEHATTEHIITKCESCGVSHEWKLHGSEVAVARCVHKDRGV
jgi:ribosomal protein S27E